MPASSVDVIGGALQSVYRHTTPHGKTQSRQIEDQLLVASKQVLVNTVEYERVGQQHSAVLGALRTKYVNLSDSGQPDTPIVGEESSNPMAHAAPPHSKTAGNREDQLDEPRVILWPREKVTLGWRKTFPPGAGMCNLGNTCYMNSSLQALFHIPSLANWLLEDLNSHTQRCQTLPNSASFCSLCAMMRTLRQTVDRTNTVIKPTHIHHKLKSIGKTLVYGRQEDAHEFIKLLLDHMEKSYLAFKRAGKLDYRSRETTPLNQIFGGYIRQQVICPVCRHVSTTFSHFQDLVLDIRSVGSVDEALNLHFRKETLDTDNAYKCEKCRKKVPATKKHMIERAPHVLLIQLKRFTMAGGKIGKHINIQRTIDISRFVNGASKQQGGLKQIGQNGSKQGCGGKPGVGMGGGGKLGGGMGCGASGGPYQYRLTSMVIHLGGTQHGGHYTAVAEASSGTMFEFDDALVRPISVQSALMRNPYILFYEMIRKPKDPQHAKPVIRQSSEKALIRQNSDGILKPIPTSHSASSVANGYGHATDNIGEVGVNRAGAHTPNSKIHLPAQKERDRISFGLKFNQNGGKGDGSCSKPSKIILNSSTATLLNSKPSPSSSSASLTPKLSSSAPTTLKSSSCKSSSSSSTTSKSSSSSSSTISRSSSSTPTTPKPISSNSGKNLGPQRSSLVPYLDDSEDSEVDDSKRTCAKIPKDKSDHNGKVKSDDQNVKVNGMKCTKVDKREKVNGSLQKSENSMSNGDVKDSDIEGSVKSNGVKTSVASGSPFLPRALHVSANHSSSNGMKNKSGECGWTVSDSSQHSPSECSSGSGGSRVNAFTVVEQPTSSCKVDQRLEQSKVQEKPENQGWTVTVKKQRPELEKAHSVDCVLPGSSHRKDEADSASLKSKASVDSCRSDHSTKSMKKSFFSLFTCVSSSRSPGSPKDEEPAAISPQDKVKYTSKYNDAEAKADKSSSSSCKQKNKKSAIDNSKKNNICENGHITSKCSSDSETESSQAKRYRDQDENEPSSPSKKCRPENKAKNGTKVKDSILKNEVGNSKFLDSSDSSKNGLGKIFEKRPKNSQYHDTTSNPKNGVSEENKRAKTGISEKEEWRNSSEVKESRKECKLQGESLHNNPENGKTPNKDSSSSVSASSLSSDSDSSDSETDETEQWVERTKETIGKAKINPSTQIVHWNGNLKDLSHTLSRNDKGAEEKSESSKKWKNTMWDGSRSTEVVDQLRRAGNMAFGTKVNTWSGGKGAVDQETEKERREAKKRSADDLYNEEFDSGRTKKVKSRKSDSRERQQSWNGNHSNSFQRVQDERNSDSWQPQHQNYRNNYRNNYHNNYHNNGNHSSPYYRGGQQHHWNKTNSNFRHNNDNNNNNKHWDKWSHKSNNKPWHHKNKFVGKPYYKKQKHWNH